MMAEFSAVNPTLTTLSMGHAVDHTYILSFNTESVKINISNKNLQRHAKKLQQLVWSTQHPILSVVSLI